MKNEIINLKIEDIGSNGEGIGKLDGYTFFVKDALPGDLIEARITKENKNYGFARLEKILEPSVLRIEPPCKIASKCGGCQIQAMDYKSQLAFKENKVKNNLERIGGLKNLKINPIMGMEDPFRYRNKSQYPVGLNKEGKIVTGFFASRTHSIIETEDCIIGPPVNNEILEKIKSFMVSNKISTYDEKTHKGLVRHILIRNGFNTGEIMVVLVINGKKLTGWEVLVEDLKNIPDITSIALNINTEKTNVILGDRIINLYGKGYITDKIKDLEFRISPLSFYQVNPLQTEILYGKALEYAGLTGKETVWDLYCGIGTISLFLAKAAGKVYGVEVVKEAIEDAKVNASINGISNAEFLVGEAENIVIKDKPDVVVVDPPRKGCDEKLLETIVKVRPERVVYVSCDSATLARDLKILCEKGYEVKEVQPVDMFPHSVHVETVVLLSQQKPSDRIEVDLDLDELDVTSVEVKATYSEIKDYVLKEHGLKVTNLYISQIKRKCGLEVGENYNLAKSEDAKQPNCPEEKEKAIVDALKHFGMI